MNPLEKLIQKLDDLQLWESEKTIERNAYLIVQ